MNRGDSVQWLLHMRYTLGLVAIIAAIITLSSLLAESGFINPSDWEVSLFKPWGVVTAHFVNREFSFYQGNMIGLSVFGILFGFAFVGSSALIHNLLDVDIKQNLDHLLPKIILASAFGSSLFFWAGYVAANALGTGGGGSGMGTSAIVSAAFGAVAGLNWGLARRVALRSRHGGQTHGSKKVLVGALLLGCFAILFVISELLIYDLLNPPTHLVSFLSAAILGFGFTPQVGYSERP